VVDLDLLEGVQEPLGQLGRVALAVLGREPVSGIPGAVRDVEVADVTDADDGGLPGGPAMLLATLDRGQTLLATPR
jgi:hypothetical protein